MNCGTVGLSLVFALDSGAFGFMRWRECVDGPPEILGMMGLLKVSLCLLL